jgi:hypothetical protein
VVCELSPNSNFCNDDKRCLWCPIRAVRSAHPEPYPPTGQEAKPYSYQDNSAEPNTRAVRFAEDGAQVRTEEQKEEVEEEEARALLPALSHCSRQGK